MQSQEKQEILNQKEIENEPKNDYLSQRFNVKMEEGSWKDRLKNRTNETGPVEVNAGTDRKRKKRWDVLDTESADADPKRLKDQNWEQSDSHGSVRTAETPVNTGSRWDETPKASGSRWDETPKTNAKSKWDQTPTGSETPSSIDYEKRNYFQSDEELNKLLPVQGYEIVPVPNDYQPIMTPHRKLQQTPTPGQQQFEFQQEAKPEIPGVSGIEFFKHDDTQFFGKLLDERDDSLLSVQELKERKIMRLLLKIKNGTPQARKTAMRQIIDNARLLGPEALFNHILPLLMSPTLDESERHLLVKVVDRLLFKLDDLVRPFCHKILVVIEPMLIDQDYYARVEGREIIANLAKACGLATMISTMRPDIDHADEFVRNTTARAFAVVASALGIPALLPFLKAVCRSQKSWQARHTGIKIIQQIAILLGPAVLPHLKYLVLTIKDGLIDEQMKVRTITGLALSALAEAASPYGIDSFNPVRDILFNSVDHIKGKNLAASFKAIGNIIPLFDPTMANVHVRKIVPRLVREFRTPDAEMKKIVLEVLAQCIQTLPVDFVKDELLEPFLKYFWVRTMAYDKRNYKQLVETTVKMAVKCSISLVLNMVVDDLKDESEAFRKLVADTLSQAIKQCGSASIDSRLLERLLDGVLFAFQEQTIEDPVLLQAFGNIVSEFSVRVQPFLPQIVSTILWRLNNKQARVRQQSADLIVKIAPTLAACGEQKYLSQLGVVLYEYLGEEYPEVLASILAGLKSIVNVIGMENMTPPIKDLLPRLTPILKNRHERVQENAVELVGRIADRGAEYVAPREWMRICFELLDMLKALKKSIRRASVNTFGYIAKAIGPQDVLSTLLNNLKVQDRQNRVCTTVAIAIVAETCSPFTVLPALLNEYRVPEMNVQNGCLKALSFLFEYIGEMGKDYVWAVSTLLEDALMDRDLIHRQIASATVKHLALGVVGMGHQDALIHLLNLIWPNIFEVFFI
jgi:splicing factor 3B subunit 1